MLSSSIIKKITEAADVYATPPKSFFKWQHEWHERGKDSNDQSRERGWFDGAIHTTEFMLHFIEWKDRYFDFIPFDEKYREKEKGNEFFTLQELYEKYIKVN